jgi:surface polysaccharide O-acyltransferase-like enzyme
MFKNLISTMVKGRHLGLDLLRVFSALGVVFIHVTAPFVTQNMKTANELFWAGNLFNVLGRVSVPIFVIISGYFILKPIPNLSAFYRKRFARILWPFACWSVIYLLWAIFFDNTRSFKIWEGVFWGKPYFHLWFLGMLMGLYAVAPLLSDLLHRIGMHQFVYVAIAAFILAMGIDAWDTYAHNRPWFGVWWVLYVGYFMIGACLRSFEKVFCCRWLLALTVLVCYAMAFTFTGLLFEAKHYVWYFYSYVSITTIAGSIALVNLFRIIDVSESWLLSEMSELTFGIYLFHMIPLNIIKKYWHSSLVDNPYLNILLISLIVFISSAIAIWLMAKVKVVKRLML